MCRCSTFSQIGTSSANDTPIFLLEWHTCCLVLFLGNINHESDLQSFRMSESHISIISQCASFYRETIKHIDWVHYVPSAPRNARNVIKLMLTFYFHTYTTSTLFVDLTLQQSLEVYDTQTVRIWSIRMNFLLPKIRSVRMSLEVYEF